MREVENPYWTAVKRQWDQVWLASEQLRHELLQFVRLPSLRFDLASSGATTIVGFHRGEG